MAEKSVEQKIKECKTVCIQNVERNIQNTMIYRYLKDEKIENDVKKYIHNSKDGFITIEFYDHEKAKAYYDKANFKDKILIRPFNIYLNVQLTDAEMKKYYIEGISEDNIRRIFEIARNYAVVKLYTSYTHSLSTGKLKPNGLLSFVRKESLTKDEFETLKKDLNEIGVNIYEYNPDKGLKCSVILTNFFEGDENQEEAVLEKAAQEQATKLMNQVLGNNSKVVSKITPTIKRREVASADNKEGVQKITKIKALVEFTSSEDAINNFEQIRKGFIPIRDVRATLYFHNSEVNSYTSLFTTGLTADKLDVKLTEKQFEDKLVDAFRKVNENVVQVNVFPFNSNGHDRTGHVSGGYVARVYLKSEQAGRDFIVDYGERRADLIEFYKNSNSIRFNISTDDKTLKKMKQFEKKAGQIMSGIKNEADKNKMQSRPYQQPLVPGFPMANIPQFGGVMPVPGRMPPNMGPMPQPGFPMAPVNQMVPPMGMGMIPQPLNNRPAVSSAVENKMKIDKFYNEKNHFVEQCKKDAEFESNIKKQIFQLVRFVL